eukprot:3393129-Pyramimonas_sp.AAC.1
MRSNTEQSRAIPSKAEQRTATQSKSKAQGQAMPSNAMQVPRLPRYPAFPSVAYGCQVPECEK